MTQVDPYSSFDHQAPNSREGAECLWARMRAEPGLPRSDRHGGFYVVTRHADLRAAIVQPGTYSSAAGVALPAEDRTPHIPEEVDPPLHRAYREILEPYLARDTVESFAPIVRRRAGELLDAISGETTIDFVAQFSRAFPVLSAVESFGFPAGDACRLLDLVNGMIAQRGTEEGRASSAALTRYIVDLLAAKRSQSGRDVIAGIASGEVEGRPLREDEQVSMTRLLLFGGFTTVDLALSATAYRFALQPELMTRLRSEPDLMTRAIEEFIRLAAPATYLRRTVTAEAALGGTALQPGDRVLLCFAAANRDEAMFERPDDVILDRSPNPHLGFGLGTHRCVGAHFARLELRIALEALLARYERFEPVPGATLSWGQGETQGFHILPLRVVPRTETPS